MSLILTLIAAAVGGGIWLWVLRYYDKVEPESVKHLLQVGLIGGLGSVIVAALLNEIARHQLGLGFDLFAPDAAVSIGRLLIFCLFVGFIEEIAKAVATVLTTKRMGDLDEPVDAMIYAMSVGLGFAVLENLLYARQFGTDVLLARFLWPVPAHMAYSAIWGYGLAKARFKYPERSTIRVMARPVAVAAVIHGIANFLLFLRVPAFAWVSLAVLAGLVYLAHIRVKRLVAESPFLEPGECPECRYYNSPNSSECASCGEPLGNTELFGTCPCGLRRIPKASDQCPACGVMIEQRDIDASVKRRGGAS